MCGIRGICQDCCSYQTNGYSENKNVSFQEASQWIVGGLMVVFGGSGLRTNAKLWKEIENNMKTISHRFGVVIDQIETSKGNNILLIDDDDKKKMNPEGFKQRNATEYHFRADEHHTFIEATISREQTFSKLIEDLHPLLDREQAEKLWVEKPLKHYQIRHQTTFNFNKWGIFFVGNNKQVLQEAIWNHGKINCSKLNIGFGIAILLFTFIDNFKFSMPSVRRKRYFE